MRASDPSGVTLDCSSEPWIGVFKGLGEVRVHSTGEFEVQITADCADSRDTVEDIERALKWGWAEPLSWARLGYRCTAGTALAPPQESRACMLLRGDLAEVAMVAVELASDGWRVVCDRFVPTSWLGDQLLAHPRGAPVLVSRQGAERAGLARRFVRTDSDAVEVEVATSHEAMTVGAIIAVTRRHASEDVMMDMRGRERFAAAASLFLGGVFSSPLKQVDGGSVELATSLRVAQIPFATLALGGHTHRQDVEALIAWWARSEFGRDKGSP